MLAGASGIDFALLVVAADDGIKPQTLEHLAIIDLLGIGRGVIALTKTDLVPPERLAEVAAEIRAAVAGTALEGAEILPVSARDGARRGRPASRLAAAAAEHPSTGRRRPLPPRRRSRLHAVRRRRRRHRHSVVRIGAGGRSRADQSVGSAGAGALAARPEPPGGDGAGGRPLRAQSGRARASPRKRSGAATWCSTPDLHAPTDRIDAGCACCRRRPSRSDSGFRCGCITRQPKSARTSSCSATIRSAARRNGRRAAGARPADRRRGAGSLRRPRRVGSAHDRRRPVHRSAAAGSGDAARRNGRRSAPRWPSPIPGLLSPRCSATPPFAWDLAVFRPRPRLVGRRGQSGWPTNSGLVVLKRARRGRPLSAVPLAGFHGGLVASACRLPRRESRTSRASGGKSCGCRRSHGCRSQASLTALQRRHPER